MIASALPDVPLSVLFGGGAALAIVVVAVIVVMLALGARRV